MKDCFCAEHPISFHIEGHCSARNLPYLRVAEAKKDQRWMAERDRR